MSESAHDALNAFAEFITEPRGDISVKVKNSLYNLTNYVLNIFFCIESDTEALLSQFW